MFIVGDAREEKAGKELEMKQAWMQANNVTEVILNCQAQGQGQGQGQSQSQKSKVKTRP